MTPKERAAMQQALEAIGDCSPNKALVNAAYALRELLEQHPMDYDQGFVDGVEEGRRQIIEQAEQEPLLKHRTGDCLMCGHCSVTGEPLYAAPVRTKDLTDAFINELHKDAQDPISFARAVIAKDREKNK